MPALSVEPDAVNLSGRFPTKFFCPAMSWLPVEITPPLLPFAGCSVIELPLIDAPAALGDEPTVLKVMLKGAEPSLTESHTGAGVPPVKPPAVHTHFSM